MPLDRVFNPHMLAAATKRVRRPVDAVMNGQSRRFWYLHPRAAADLPLAARLRAGIALSLAAGEASRAADTSDALLDYIERFAHLVAA